MIHNDRLEILTGPSIEQIASNEQQQGKYVLYWMQSSQRVNYNHALEYAIDKANRLKLPVIVYFGLYNKFPHGNARHFTFMLEGLKEVEQQLNSRNIEFVCKFCHPVQGAKDLAKQAALLVVDKGYLKFEKQWKREAIKETNLPIHQVESEAVIPVKSASHKEEYSAYTLRKKMHSQINKYLDKLHQRRVSYSVASQPGLSEIVDKHKDLTLSNNSIPNIINDLKIDHKVPPSQVYQGGETEAATKLQKFVTSLLEHYPDRQNDPGRPTTSRLSPYLHFGQISPLDITFQIYAQNKDISHPFLEQLIVRRELALNFVEYNSDYDSLDSLPDWAKKTLDEHRQDSRTICYNLQDLETANTYDEYFNAAQTELLTTGKIHNYIRIYWGKKIIEWSETPEQAHETLCYLNDKYALDGRDPNGYTNILWCFGKHDRAFQERQILGKVRYMSDKALKRNGNPKEYIKYQLKI